jgi:predicted metal-binding membrane protein
MRIPQVARGVPIGIGVVVLLAGVLQFTRWKAHHLACCRAVPADEASVDARAAWRYGLRHGLHCSACCAGLTAILLALGMMDLRVMALVTAAITVERLAPAELPMARIVGAIVVAVGMARMALTLTGTAA